MAWTDAARQASAMVRRAHAKGRVTASGKKAVLRKWYHGTSYPIRGVYLSPKFVKEGSTIAAGKTYFSKDLKYARIFSRFPLWKDQKLAPRFKPIYVAQPTFSKRIRQVFDSHSRTVEARVPTRVRYLPRARGRAARGKY